MKRVNVLLAIVLGLVVLSSCGGQTSKEEVNNVKKVSAIEVSIDSLLRDASALDGETVKFIATVDHACMHGGKRLTVFGTEKGRTMKIDASESSPKFASNLMGKQVEITGVVAKVPGSHVADCEKEEDNIVPEIAYVVNCLDIKEIE